MQILYRYPIHSFIVCLNETNKTNIDNLIRGVVLTETAQFDISKGSRLKLLDTLAMKCWYMYHFTFACSYKYSLTTQSSDRKICNTRTMNCLIFLIVHAIKL